MQSALPSPAEHLEDAQRIAHVGSWERDIATGVLWWSDEACRILGIEPGTFEGTLDAFLGFVHPDDRHLATPTETQLASSTSLESEYRVVRPDGTIRVIHELAEFVRARRRQPGPPARHVPGRDRSRRGRGRAGLARLRRRADRRLDLDAGPRQQRHRTSTGRSAAATATSPRRSSGSTPGSSTATRTRPPSSTRSGRPRPRAGRGRARSSTGARTGPSSRSRRSSPGSRTPTAGSSGTCRPTVTSPASVPWRAPSSATPASANRSKSALARIDSSASPEEIAATACAEILGFSNVDTAFVIILEPDEGWVLAHVGTGSEHVPVGAAIPASRLHYLRDRATGGPMGRSVAQSTRGVRVHGCRRGAPSCTAGPTRPSPAPAARSA